MSFFLSLAVRPFACSGRAAYAHATQAERRWCKSSRGLFMVGRDTSEPNARGDRVRLACKRWSSNRESPGFSHGECQPLSPLFLAPPFAFLPRAKGGTYAPVAQWIERPDDAGEQRWFESSPGLGDPHFSR